MTARAQLGVLREQDANAAERQGVRDRLRSGSSTNDFQSSVVAASVNRRHSELPAHTSGAWATRTRGQSVGGHEEERNTGDVLPPGTRQEDTRHRGDGEEITATDAVQWQEDFISVMLSCNWPSALTLCWSTGGMPST